MTALYDYDPLSGDELAFREGDRLAVYDDASDPDWWLVRLNVGGQEQGGYGLLPANYVAAEESPSTETTDAVHICVIFTI